MLLYDTIIYNGLEQSFAGWGIDLGSVSSHKVNMESDKFELTIPTTNITDNSIFPFESIITVYAARTSSTGAPNSFSGGVPKFQGKQVSHPRQNQGGNQGITFEFQGPWYDLEHTQYLQTYKGFVNFYAPGEIILNTSTQQASGTLIYISVGDQIQSILQWVLDQYKAQSMAAPFQYVGRTLNNGAIDLSSNSSPPNAYKFSVASNTTIDTALFGLALPSYIGKPMTCADALKKELELSPRTSIGFDYTTNPPTVYVRSVDNFTPVNLPLVDGVSQKGVRIIKREDLVARAVVLTYRITNTQNGSQGIDYVVDKWGPHGGWNSTSGLTDTTGDPSAGLRVIADTIDLQGYNVTTTTANLDCEPLAARGGTTATKRAWWASNRGNELKKMIDSRIRFQTLVETNAGEDITVNATGIPDATFTYASNGVDSTGAAVVKDQELTAADYAFYTNRIVRGTYHTWMTLKLPVVGGAPVTVPVKSVKVNCKASIQYVEYDTVVPGDVPGQLPLNETQANLTPSFYYDPIPDSPAGSGIVLKNTTTEHHCDLELTNGTTGPYSTIQSVTPGETYVVGSGGIAQYLFNALAVPQYEGDYVKVETKFAAGVSIVNTVNFTGGRTEWTKMNAQVQSVREDWGKHETSIQIGPAKHLSAAQLSSMLNMWRNRRPWYNPAVRTDNTGSGGTGSVSMPQTAGGANGTKGADVNQGHAAVSYATPGVVSSGPAAIVINDPARVAAVYAGETSPVPVAGVITTFDVNNPKMPQWRTLKLPTGASGAIERHISLCGAPYTVAGDGSISGVTATKMSINVVSGNPEIYANYFVASSGTSTTSATGGSGSAVIVVANAAGIDVDDIVTGTNIPAHTSVLMVSGNSITLSANPSGTLSGNYVFKGLFRIAKNAKLRNSVSSETIDSVAYSYAYGASSPYTYVSRKATWSGGGPEFQVIVPRFIGGDEVWVIEIDVANSLSMVSVADSISSTPGFAIPFLDINVDGRAWYSRFSQAGYENV